MEYNIIVMFSYNITCSCRSIQPDYLGLDYNSISSGADGLISSVFNLRNNRHYTFINNLSLETTGVHCSLVFFLYDPHTEHCSPRIRLQLEILLLMPCWRRLREERQ